MKKHRIAAGALLLAVLPALPASGQASDSTTVSVATLGPGTRQLELLDLTGQPLANLPLTPGVPQAFRVRVSDDQIHDLTTGFTVSAVMGNLYRSDGSGGHVWTDKIPSSDVQVSYPTSPFSSLGISYAALPKVQVTGTLPDCTTLSTLLSLSLASLAGTGLCGIVGTVGSGFTLPAPVTVPSTLDAAISGAVKAPYALTGNEVGNFPAPNYATGIGASAVGHDPAAVANQAGTPRTVMVGAFTGIANLLADVNAAVAGLSAGLADVSPTGSGALTTLPATLTALSGQGQSALSNAIAALPSASQQVAVLSQLGFSLLPPTVADLAREVGTYNAFPMLQVSPTGSVSTGTYQGTLTVTMVQP